METDNQANNPALPQGFEAIIKATVEKTIAGLLESNFGQRGRDRSRSRSRGDRSRSGSKGRFGGKGKRDRSGSRGRRDRSGSRGRRDRSGSRGRRDRSGSRGRRDRSGSRGRRDRSGERQSRFSFPQGWEEYGPFRGGPFRHHHFHHPPPWAYFGEGEWDFPQRGGRWGKWGKFGRRFHRGFYMNEENGPNTETDKENAKESTPAPEKDLRVDFQRLDVTEMD